MEILLGLVAFGFAIVQQVAVAGTTVLIAILASAGGLLTGLGGLAVLAGS